MWRLIALALVVLGLMPLRASGQADNTVPLAEAAAIAEERKLVGAAAQWPRVRLTPPVIEVAGLEGFRLSLNGHWDFVHELPEKFGGKAADVESWSTVKVPGHFALQGFEPMGSTPGRAVGYSKSFEVPAEFAGRVVMLRFDAIDGLVRLWVNGQPVGSSDSAFLPVEFDVTRHLRPGQANTITLSVEVSDLTGWYLRELGGIGRDVYLLALPAVHISRLHVDTPPPAENDPADASRSVVVTCEVSNFSREKITARRLRFEVFGPDAKVVSLPENSAEVEAITPGESRQVRVELAVPDARTWDPEHPRLYRIEATLSDHREAPSMTVARPFGFRHLTLDGGTLRVNGRPIKLFGANYHVTAKGFGHHPPGELIRRDVALLNGLNLNALRAWPTPYREYIDACNELGMFTTIEVPINLQLYAKGPRGDHGNNPALFDPYLSLAARVIETYRSDPSVLLWGLGNESIYYDYFQQAGHAIAAEEPTRPIFFGGDGRMGVDIPAAQVNDEHYPRGGTTTFADLGDITGEGWSFPLDAPAISTEWAHLHVNNQRQIALDPGVDDYWGFYAQAHADWTVRTPNFLGGFIFLSMPYHDVGDGKEWRAFFDDHRRPTTYAWHVQKANSPVRLNRASVKVDKANRRVRFMLLNRFNFTNLTEVRFEWEQGEASGQLSVDAGPGKTAQAEVDYDPQGPPLTLTAIGPVGRVIDRYVLVDRPPVLRRVKLADAVALTQSPDRWRIDTGVATWDVSPTTGLLLQATVGDTRVVTGGPDLVVRGHGHPNPDGQLPAMTNLLDDWTADTVEIRRDGDRVVVKADGAYRRATGKFELTFEPGEMMRVDYDFEFTWDTPGPFPMFEQGISLRVSPTLDTLFWSRRAQWSAYPDDHPGRAYGVSPALGKAHWRQARQGAVEGATPTWPWSMDLQGGVTRDFRSSRLDFDFGGLHAGGGPAVVAIAAGRQHLRATPIGDDPARGFDLQVNDFFSGGSEFHLMKSISIERRALAAGTPLQGTVQFRVLPTLPPSITHVLQDAASNGPEIEGAP